MSHQFPESDKLFGPEADAYLTEEHQAAICAAVADVDENLGMAIRVSQEVLAEKASKKSPLLKIPVSIVGIEQNGLKRFFAFSNKEVQDDAKFSGGEGSFKPVREILPIRNKNGEIQSVEWVPMKEGLPLFGVKKTHGIILDEDRTHELQVMSHLGIENIPFTLESRKKGHEGIENAYHIQPYFAGGDLSRVMEKAANDNQQAFSTKDTFGLVGAIVKEVIDAHNAGVYHGDISERNICLDQEGKPKLIDFGQSAFTHESRKKPVAEGETFKTVDINEGSDNAELAATMLRLLSDLPADKNSEPVLFLKNVFKEMQAGNITSREGYHYLRRYEVERGNKSDLPKIPPVLNLYAVTGSRQDLAGLHTARCIGRADNFQDLYDVISFSNTAFTKANNEGNLTSGKLNALKSLSNMAFSKTAKLCQEKESNNTLLPNDWTILTKIKSLAENEVINEQRALLGGDKETKTREQVEKSLDKIQVVWQKTKLTHLQKQTTAKGTLDAIKQYDRARTSSFDSDASISYQPSSTSSSPTSSPNTSPKAKRKGSFSNILRRFSSSSRRSSSPNASPKSSHAERFSSGNQSISDNWIDVPKVSTPPPVPKRSNFASDTKITVKKQSLFARFKAWCQGENKPAHSPRGK